MRATYHLVPVDDWVAAGPEAESYRAPSLADEGFIHCTDGVDGMVATANRYYAGDPRPFLVLSVDLDALSVPWRYDDAERRYPHVYGPIDRAAIVSVVPIPRGLDGRFLPFEL